MTRRVKEPLEVKDLDIAGIPIGSVVFGGLLAAVASEKRREARKRQAPLRRLISTFGKVVGNFFKKAEKN